MRTGVAISIALTLGLLMTAMPATAFHGSPYVLVGKGSLAGLPVGVWDARLEWNGGGVFRLTIVDPVTHISLVSASILGRESLPATFLGVAGCAFLERIDPYVGTDSQTGGTTFRATGVQDNCLSNGLRYMRVAGTYSQTWSFDVTTGVAFG